MSCRRAQSRGGDAERDGAFMPGRKAKTAHPRPRVKQLEIENLHLKQLIGNLSLEKKLLLERLRVSHRAEGMRGSR